MGNLDSANSSLQQCEALIAPTEIYPCYEASVHSGICGTAIEGFGWLVIFQTVVGVLILPGLAESATTFLARWAAWQEHHGEAAAREVQASLLQGNRAV